MNPQPSQPDPWRLIVLAVAALLPIALGLLLPRGGPWFFLLLASVCLAAPGVGFCWGEMRGKSGEGRAAIGCLSTVGLFILYLVWVFAVLPSIRP